MVRRTLSFLILISGELLVAPLCVVLHVFPCGLSWEVNCSIKSVRRLVFVKWSIVLKYLFDLREYSGLMCVAMQ
jgi:hypothetical protein